MKRLLFFLMAIIFAIQGFTQQGEITIGNGTSTTLYVPMHCNYDYSYSQTIYTSSEIIGGTISQIAYYMTSTTSRTEVIDIYAGNSTKTSFSSTTDYESLSNLTQVFSGSVTFVQGWNYITFTIPFLYNGTDNLIIAVDKNTDSYSSRSWQSHTTSFASCLYFYQDNTNIDPNSPTATNKSTLSSRPNTKFVITPSAPGFCWAPNNLGYSDLTSNSAKISWRNDLNVSSYSISLKTIDQTWEQATLIATLSDTSYTLTNLLPSTSYDVKVTPVCTTPLSSIVSFTTLCATLSVPTITEEFNSVPPNICWERKSGLLPASGPATLTTTTYGWSLNSYVTPSNARVNIYGSSLNYWLISPSIDLGNGTTPMQLEFDVFYTDNGNANPVDSSGYDDRFAVVISTDNGVTWEAANAFIWSSDINSSRILGNITNTPSHVIIPLYNQSNSLPYTGTIKIGFYGESTVSNTDNDLHIDNFVINPFESCRKPSNIAVSSLTSTSANISFQENGTATTWQYALTTNGNDPNNITPISVTTNPILLTNLTPNTRYTIWIRSDCSTETSNWSNKLSFTTDALPATIPYTCNFENQLENSAWRNLSGSVNNWAIGQAAGNGPTTQNTSDNTSAYISNDEGLSYAMTDGYIYAYGYRDIDFGTTPASYSLNFDWKCKGYVSGTSVYSGLIVFLRNVTDTLNPTGNPSNVNDNLALLSQSENWQNKEITIDNVSGVKRLIFYYFDRDYNYAPPAAIDNISVEILPCPRPFNVTMNSLSSTQAQIGWSSNVGNSWYLYYKSTFDAFYDSILVNTNTYTLQNLIPQATYTYYLRTKCGTELSDPTNIYTFTTPCQEINTFPWNEGFEGIAATNELPPCWSATNLGSKTYTQISNYGSRNRNARTGTKSAYFSWSCNDKFTTPNFNLTAGQSYDFSFWYVTDGLSGWQSLKAGVSQVGNQASYQTIGTALTNITNTSYALYRGSFTPNTTGLYEFSIECQANSTPYYLTIDDISLTLTPSCLMPTALLASNPTSTGFDLNWIDESGSLYNIQYMPATETDWANATTISGVTKPYPLNTLNHSTSYKVRVQTACGTEQSEWSTPITYTTACGTITNFPWTEGFENTFVPAVLPGNKTSPLCWYIVDSLNTDTYFWKATTSPYSGSSSIYMLGYASSTTTSSTYNNNDWLISPIITLTGSERLNFWAKKSSATYKPDLLIYALNVSQGDLNTTTPNSNFVLIGQVDTTVLSTTYAEYEFNLSSLVGDYRLAFVRKKIANGSVYIDDVKVSEIPTCLIPTALTTSNPTTTGFDLGWTDTSGSLYNIQYMPATQTDWANATTISGVTSNSYTFNTLNSGTIYKVRVQTDCGNKQSEWSLPINDTTFCATITTLPYTESFDNYGTGSTIYPLCWSRLYNATSANPYINSTNFSSPGSMYFTAATGKNSFAITPQFDASIQISSLSARFQLRSGNATSNIIVGVLTNPTDSLSFIAIDTLLPAASSVWQEFEVDFADYSGNGQYIAFKSEYNTTTNTCYIDDLTVYTTPSCERPIAISANSSTNSITINITPSQITDNGWKVYYRVANSANWDSINITSNIATIPNLQPQTVYEIYAKTLCSDATYSFSNSSIFAETKQIPVQTSYASNFEAQGDNGWILRNGTSVNKWMIGKPVGARSNGLFISNNNTNATYTITSQSVVIAEKLFTINSPDSLELSFDALIGGESTSDYLKVFLVDKDTVFSPSLAATYFSENSYSEGIIMPNGTNNYINLIPATHFKARFVSPGIGVQKKLIFVWRNNSSSGNQPSAYIDNVALLNIITPYPPTNLHATPSISTSQLTWTAGAAELGWQVRKGETGTPAYVTTPTYQANNLTPSTEYTYYIRSYYADDTLYSAWIPVSFRTLAIPQRVTTLAATAIGQRTATLHGTLIPGTDTIINQGFQYRVIAVDTNWTSVSTVFDDTIAYNLTGLLPYAVYEFRAFASTAYVTINGRSQSFTTLPAPPSAITSPAAPVEQTVATLNGIVTQGTRPLTAKGFEWRLVGATTWTTVTSPLTDAATTYNLTGLIPITNYEYRVYATTASEIVYGDIESFTTLAIVPPVVTTTPATSIAQTIATLNANIVLGSEIITALGFEWRLTGASTWTTLTSTLNAGIITNNLTGIVASTDYEYRAYATTASGSVYGDIESFTTLAIVPPTVISGAAIAVAQTIETLNGSITAGSELITNQGFEWRLLGQSVWTPITVSLVDNAMTYSLTALTANTNYEFRAFATTESATTYGNIVAFRTLALDPPVVTTTAATLISQTYATLNGSAIEIMAPITSQGFEWRLSSETSWTTITATPTANILTYNLTGLTALTNYEFRAFATTSEGTVYGTTQSFRTLPIAPIVVTSPATSITQIIATLNGAVTDGSETISAKGFEWRKVGVTSWTNITLTENTLVYNLTGIVANTNYEFRAYATTESGTVYGITQTFTTLAIVPPTVISNVATLVDQTVATINGAITSGSELILSQGFEWKLASATAWTQITSIPVSNAITHNLTGLTPDRAYEFRAFATTESATTYGTIQSFSTLVIPQTVVTNPASSITETNATLNAIVTSGSELITNQGFEWKMSSSNTWTVVTAPLTGNALTHSLIGLTPNMAYEFRAYATTPSATIYGQIQNFNTLAIPTVVVSNPATSVAQTTATLNGTITIGSKPLTSQGFEWKLASASTWTVVAKSLTGNVITHNLTGLTANTSYEYRAYAINASETIYGDVQIFTTLATAPTVVTNAATLVAQTTATLNGAITIGSEQLIAQGFEWKLSSASAWIAQTSTLNANAITHNLTGLNPNSAYQYRAYATTLSGTVYGTTQNFTTLAVVPPIVVTSPAAAISQNAATLNGTVTVGSDAILVQGFEWKLSSASTWTAITATINGNAITHNLFGLTPNSAYQYRAYATTSAGTVYGTTQNFTTLAVIPPTVVTNAATLITQNTATINGTITLGSESIIFKGFEYKLASSSTWIPLVVNASGSAINYNLTGLIPNSAYQFRAHASTVSGIVYGTTLNFTTLAIVNPVVVTNAATSVAQTTATLNGTITIGSEAVITQGFEWTLSNSTTWNITTENLTANGITRNLTGLAPNTAYKYRAYAVTQSGTIYGQVQNFTTLAINAPTVVTNAASAITETTATLNGTITPATETITSKGFEWRVANTNIWMPITITASALTHNLTGLTPNTSYEYRAMATTPTLTVYGEIQNFTTLAIIPPTVVTNPINVTSSTEVTLSGTITAGSETILAQGFEWKEAGASQWTVVAGTLTGNTITYNLTGLTPNHSYRFRAAVATESGITYGETQIFTTLGLNGVDGKEISIKMYPNPAKIQTKLIVSGISGDVKIILSDVQGRILSTVNTEAVSGVLDYTLDLNDLVEGVYYIRIQNSIINKTQKLIVK